MGQSISSSFLRRPEAPTPAKWNAAHSESFITTTATIPAEKGRDAGDLSGVARTPKRDVSAMLRLVGESNNIGDRSKTGEAEEESALILPPIGSSPYSPSEKTQELELFSPPSIPAEGDVRSPIPDAGDDEEEPDILSPLSDWNSSVVVYEKNTRSPSTWKSGSVSTYVNVPSPFNEKILGNDMAGSKKDILA